MNQITVVKLACLFDILEKPNDLPSEKLSLQKKELFKSTNLVVKQIEKTNVFELHFDSKQELDTVYLVLLLENLLSEHMIADTEYVYFLIYIDNKLVDIVSVKTETLNNIFKNLKTMANKIQQKEKEINKLTTDLKINDNTVKAVALYGAINPQPKLLFTRFVHNLLAKFEMKFKTESFENEPKSVLDAFRKWLQASKNKIGHTAKINTLFYYVISAYMSKQKHRNIKHVNRKKNRNNRYADNQNIKNQHNKIQQHAEIFTEPESEIKVIKIENRTFAHALLFLLNAVLLLVDYIESLICTITYILTAIMYILFRINLFKPCREIRKLTDKVIQYIERYEQVNLSSTELYNYWLK